MAILNQRHQREIEEMKLDIKVFVIFMISINELNYQSSEDCLISKLTYDSLAYWSNLYIGRVLGVTPHSLRLLGTFLVVGRLVTAMFFYALMIAL